MEEHVNHVGQQYHGEHWTEAEWNETRVGSSSTASQALTPMPATLDYLHEANYSARSIEGSNKLLG
jgi:hypothetical protein